MLHLVLSLCVIPVAFVALAASYYIQKRHKTG